MTERNSTAAYDLELFNAIPKHIAEPEQEPHLVREKAKTKEDLKSENKISAKTAVKIFAVAAVLFAFFGAIIFSRITLTLSQRDAETIKSEIKTAQNENVKLNLELNAMISDEKVDEYASDVLNMKKLERYQIHYFETDGGDEAVVYSDAGQ